MTDKTKTDSNPAATFSTARTAGNSINIIASRASELLFSFFTIILVTRYLGPEQFGLYAFIFTIAFTVKNVMESGVTRIVIREVSADLEKSSEVIVAALGLNFLMSLVGMLICAVVAVLFKLTFWEEIVALYIALLAQILLGMVNTVIFSFIAHGRTVYNLVVTLSNRILVIVLISTVILLKKSYIFIFGAMLVGNFSALIFALFIFNFKFQKITIQFNFEFIKYFFRESLPFTASILLIQVSMSLNIFLVKLLNEIQQLSFYQVPNRVVNAFNTVPTSIFLVILPFFTHSAADNSMNVLRLAYARIVKYIFAVMLPFCVIVTFFASDIIILMFGKEFFGAKLPLQIIIWSLIPFPIAALSEIMITSLKKQRVLVITYAIFFCVNLTLGILLIPGFEAIGASIALLAALFFQFFSMYFFVTREIGYVSVLRCGLRPFASMCFLILLVLLLQGVVNPLIVIFIGLSGYYIALVMIFKTFNQEEKDEIVKLLNRLLRRGPAGRPGNGIEKESKIKAKI